MKSAILFPALLAALLLTACSKVEQDWERVSEDNTVAAYESHLLTYPDSPHAAEAKAQILQLHWQAAQDANTMEALENFIENHADAAYRDKAVSALEELRALQQEADLADMAEKLRAFLNGDQDANVITRLCGQEFVPRAEQPQSNIRVFAGSEMMAVIGGKAQIVYVADGSNGAASVAGFAFAEGATLELTNGRAYTWREGDWIADET